MKKLILTIMMAVAGFGAFAQVSASEGRRARNMVVSGNELFRDNQFADAEVMYRKALEADASFDVAKYNLAASLLRQRTAADTQAQEAVKLLNELVTSELTSDAIAEKSFYNLGNIAFNKQEYAASIESYKNALRKNPDNDKARENLYLAQRKLQEQQNQDNNQNQDNKDDQQKQDQDKQDQKNDQQNKDQQNQDQNQDKNKDENKDQNGDNQQQPQEQNQNPDQQQQNPQQRPGQISPENAQQILKAMEKEENATRARIEKENAEKAKRNVGRRTVTNPW